MSLGTCAHALYGSWIGDPEVDRALSGEADVAAMLRFETELAAAEAAAGLIPEATAIRISGAAARLAIDWPRLRREAARDGVAAPGLVRQLREAVGGEAASFVHFGATSQDAVDTSLTLRLSALVPVFADRLEAAARRLDDLAERFGDHEIMAVTRGRDALAIRVRDRIAGWRRSVVEQRALLLDLRRDALAVQLAGPVGTLDALGAAGPTVRARLAAQLELADPEGSWHADRRRVLSVGVWAATTSAGLGKIGADLLLMAQDRIGEARLAGGGSSSMPHKVNPVDAELLVALARSAAASLASLQNAALHESERSGVAWTLEWIALAQTLSAFGTASLASLRLLDSVESLG